MRAVIAFVSLGVVSCLPMAAHGAAACSQYWRGPNAVEWVEQGTQHGARIVARDPRWKVYGLTPYATSHAACDDCTRDTVGAAVLWLNAGDTAGGDLEKAVSPETVARVMSGFPFRLADANVHTEAPSVAVTVGGFAGRARPIEIDYRNGRSKHVVAFSAVQGACLVLYGILYSEKAEEVATSDISAFTSAIDVEAYVPKPDAWAFQGPNLRETELPLGNAFQPRDLDDAGNGATQGDPTQGDATQGDAPKGNASSDADTDAANGR